MKKTIDLKCKNCGAIMEISDDKTEVTCPYCRYKYLLEKQLDIKELSQREEKLSYARESGERKAIEDSIIRQKKRKLLFVISIVVTLFVFAIIKYFSLEYMKDPFECVSVVFSGKDGSGTVKVTDNKTCDNYAYIKYTFLKNENLVEGEKIKINAFSDKYRFGISTKEYTVSGLSKYLIDLNQLNEEMINKLHNFSYEHLNTKAFTGSFKGEIVNFYPYKIYLYTNNEYKNILYDVYKAEIRTKSGNTYEKYLVAYYKDFIILNSSELFSYSKLYHAGSVIKAGDPNENNAFSNNYAGYLIGFETIDEFKSYLNKDNDGTFEIKEK